MVQGGKVGVALKGKRLRRAALAALMLTSSLGMVGVAAPAQAQEAARDFNIPAQPLANALAAFGQQSGLQVSAQAPLIEGRTSSAVRGALPPLQALSQLLTGTGLSFRLVGSTVTLEPAPQSIDGAITLGPVRVEGAADGRGSLADLATTEGSGTYAASSVTLGKTTQQRREIPQSVSVVTRQQMDDQNLTTLFDTLRQATGVFSTQAYDGTGNFFSRGYALEAQFDGAPVGQSGLNGLPQFDMALYDRLEILRGPSGLLSGAGTPAGSVNLVRKRPLDKFQIAGSLMAGSWQNFHGDFDITGPLNTAGTIRGRLIAAGQDRDFFYDGTHSKQFTASALLDIDLTPTTTVALAAVIQRSKLTGGNAELPVYSDGSLPGWSRSTAVGAPWTQFEFPIEEYSAEIRQKISERWSMTGLLRYRDSTFDSNRAISSGYIDPVSQTIDFSGRDVDWSYKHLDMDFHIQGSIPFLGRDHDLLVGYNSSLAEYGGRALDYYISGVDVLNPDVDPQFVPADADGFIEQIKQSGFYARANVKLADTLTVVVGGRVTRFYDRGSDLSESNWEYYADQKGEFTPYGGIVWDVTPNVSLYASYADIFQAQFQRDVNNRVLPPRVGWQIETGVKGDFFDGGLSTTLALFRIRDTNRPMNDPDPTHICDTWNGRCTVAAGLVRSQGVEAEISGKITPQWNIITSYTYNDVKHLEGVNAALIGTRVTPDLPAHMVKLWTSYSFDRSVLGGRLSGLTVGGGLVAQSETYAQAADFRVRQGGFATVDLQVGYQINKNLQASFTANNLFDKSYFERVTTSTVRYGAPRNVMFTLRARY